ncbi:MAG: hypothetical protein ACOYN2_04470 [Patescibacteria group bacterium]
MDKSITEVEFLAKLDAWIAEQVSRPVSEQVKSIIDQAGDQVALKDAIGITFPEEIDHKAYEIQALIEELINLHSEIREEAEEIGGALMGVSGEYGEIDETEAVYKLGEFVYRYLCTSFPNGGRDLPEDDPLVQLGKLLGHH